MCTLFTRQGQVEEIRVLASVGGRLPPTLADEMGAAASKQLSRAFPAAQVSVERLVHRNAACNGSGLLCVARTSKGCILADSAVGGPKTRPRDTGLAAADALLASLSSGACVDRWMQVSPSNKKSLNFFMAFLPAMFFCLNSEVSY
jgi:RNA 3'-terminal phosphate cyclase